MYRIERVLPPIPWRPLASPLLMLIKKETFGRVDYLNGIDLIFILSVSYRTRLPFHSHQHITNVHIPQYSSTAVQQYRTPAKTKSTKTKYLCVVLWSRGRERFIPAR